MDCANAVFWNMTYISHRFINSISRHRSAEGARTRRLVIPVGICRPSRAHQPPLSERLWRGIDRPRRSIVRFIVDMRRRLSKSWSLVLNEGVYWSIVVVVIIVAQISQLLKVDLVAENTADAAKALDKLIALGGSI
jgi:hypothetical protein